MIEKTSVNAAERLAPGELSLVYDSVCSVWKLKLALLLLLLQETESDFDNCAVCIEGYKPSDVVRILPCR